MSANQLNNASAISINATVDNEAQKNELVIGIHMPQVIGCYDVIGSRRIAIQCLTALPIVANIESFL